MTRNDGPTPASEPGWDPPLSSLPQVALAVFADRGEAARATNDLISAGVDRRAIRVDTPEDRRDALRGEMREETDHPLAGPMGAMTKEEARGAAATVLIGAVGGALVGAAFSVIPFGVDWWERFVILLAVGIAAGATIGFIAGATFLRRGPADSAAAIRGVTVAVEPATHRAIEVLRHAHPIRVDRLTATGDTLGAITTEAVPSGGATPTRFDQLRGDPTSQQEWATDDREDRPESS